MKCSQGPIVAFIMVVSLMLADAPLLAKDADEIVFLRESAVAREPVKVACRPALRDEVPELPAGFAPAVDPMRYSVQYERDGKWIEAGFWISSRHPQASEDWSVHVLDAVRVNRSVFVLSREAGGVRLAQFVEGKAVRIVPIPQLRESDAKPARYSAGLILGDTAESLSIVIFNTAARGWPSHSLQLAELMPKQE